MESTTKIERVFAIRLFAMNTHFKLNQQAFEKSLKKKLVDVGSTHIKDLNRLAETMQGDPVADIKRALTQMMRRKGGKISEPELTEYANRIHKGVKFSFSGVNFT